MLPQGEMVLAAPAAVIGAALILWEVLRVVPLLHWVVVFVPLTFGLLAIHRLYAAPLSEYGHEKFFGLMTLTLFSAAAASLIRKDGGFTPLARVWVICAIYLTAASLVTGTGTRAAAFGANPIWLARALAIGLVFTGWLHWTRQLRASWAFLASIILLVGLFASGSRGPLLGAVVGLLVLVFASKMSGGRKFMTLLGAAVAMVVLPKLPIFAESRIIAIATGEVENDLTRNAMWSESLRVIGENPMGVGYGNWSSHVDGLARHNYPHNLFLEVFVEQGVLVGLLFSIIVACVLIGIFKKSKKNKVALGALAWLVAEIVNVSVSGDINARTFFFALTFAFLISVWKTPQPEIAEGSNLGKQNPKESSSRVLQQ